MGIHVDYNDDDYKSTVPSMVLKLMLPMTKAQLKAQMASKECVVGVTVGSSLKSKVPVKNRNFLVRGHRRVNSESSPNMFDHG
jgi:hypothetical protein